MTEIEVGAKGIVEEDAEGASGAVVDEKGNALVDGVGGLLPAKGVGVPHGEGSARAIEGARLITEAEEVGIDRLLLVDDEAGAAPLDGPGILLKDGSAKIGDSEAEVSGDGYSEGGGLKAHGRRDDFDGGGASFGQHGPGGIFRKLAGVRRADAKNIIAESCHLENGRSRCEFYAIGEGFDLR